jgi:hypothetical protein
MAFFKWLLVVGASRLVDNPSGLSTKGAAPTTGVLITGEYRLFISSATDSTQKRDRFNADNSFKRDRFNADNLPNPQLFVDNLHPARPLLSAISRPFY